VTFNLLESTRAVFVSDASAQEKLVALALLNHWSRSTQTFPGVERLVKWTSLSRRTVQRAIQELERRGAIVVDRKMGLANRYDLSPLTQMTSATQAPVSDGHRCHGDTPGVSERHPTGVSLTPHPCQPDTRSDPLSDPTRDPVKGSKPRRSAPASKVTRPRGLKKAKPEPRWPGAHSELTKRYFEIFERHRGEMPFFRPREGKAIAELLDTTDGDVDQAATLIDNGLSNWDQATILTIVRDPTRAQRKAGSRSAAVGGTRAGELLGYTSQRIHDLEAEERRGKAAP
jgi:hypothetical protein